jgi:hypothetical protein
MREAYGVLQPSEEREAFHGLFNVSEQFGGE